KRLVVLRGILESEEVYLRELDALLTVNHLGLYGGFIENYEKAVEVVRKCTQSNSCFRTLAELLYKPLDRVTKTTLVLRQDLLKTTPVEHKDHAALQEALRLSQSFLSGVNESSQSKRERRQLMRDGFVVDVSEGVPSLRHLFLYTDLLLCTRFKHA
uniref:DH domain-containing protein n=1 Tax=Fundulus heteroclitus TaxID=8078 RepID=A0A3Q2Q6R6_FUNHE